MKKTQSTQGQHQQAGVPAMTKLVAYIRVSTTQQGRSGLGLEAQAASIATYAEHVGGQVMQTYTEVESGRKTSRVELEKAIAHAKQIRGCLVIAKLDRLARDVEFIAHLLKDTVAFVAVDFPQANKVTLQIMSVIAESEAEMISARTKAALAAAKARGVKLGSARPGHWEGREEIQRAAARKGRKAALAQLDAKFTAMAGALLPIVNSHRQAGLSMEAVAAKLNEGGYVTLRGKPWTTMAVSRFLKAVEGTRHTQTR
jgi:DNA invertase Pin-like site-specific DNA recombinase